jgi:PAS domain S-box-containing protein
MSISSRSHFPARTRWSRSSLKKIWHCSNPAAWPVTKQISCGFSLAIVLLVVVGLMVYQTTTGLVASINAISQSQQIVAAFGIALSAAKDIETGARGYLIAGQEQYLKPYYDGMHEFQKQMKNLRRLTVNDAARNRKLDALDALLARNIAQTSGMFEVRRTKGWKTAAGLAGAQREIMDEIRGAIRGANEEEYRRLKEGRQRAQRTARKAIVAVAAFGGLALAALVALAQFSVRTIARDLARRKVAEDAVRASEAQYRLLFENSPLPMWIVDQETLRFLAVNDAAIRHYGFSREEFLSATAAVIRPVRDPAPPGAAEGTVIANTGMEEHRRKDGSVIQVEVTRHAVMFGGRRALFVLAQDLTDRRRAEEGICRLASIVESSDDAIIGTSLDGIIETWNPAAQRLYGYPAAEAIGRPVSMLMPQDRSHELSLILARIRSGGHVPSYETERLTRNGDRMDISLTVSPVKDAAGKVIGASAVERDITRLKQTEKELRDLSARLLQLQDEERRRIARELHDTTGQNLAALEMNLALMHGAAAGLDPAAQQLLSDALGLVKQSSDEIRTLSYVLHPPLLEEAGLASALRAYSEGYTARTGIQLRIEIPPDLGRLPHEMEITLFRVAQQALANVHRHSQSPTAEIRLFRERGAVHLQIKDRGRGMPADVLKRLEHGVPTLGVGIAGMRERLRQLGGQLAVHSSPQGATIEAVLPPAAVVS